MKLFLATLLAALGVFVAVTSIMSYRRARVLTHVRRHSLWGDPAKLDLRYEDVAFQSRGDSIELRGWYLPTGDDRRCIVLVQGADHHRNSPGIRALELGRDLVGRGYSVLLFDFRGRGESGGSYGGAGHSEQRDLLGALDYVTSRGIPLERTGLVGFSLGAGVAIAVAAGDKRVPAVVSDSGFLDAAVDVPAVIGAPLNRLPWSTLAARLGSLAFLGTDLAGVRPMKAVAKIAPRPILFIHGQTDRVVAVEESEELYRLSANPRAELWIVPGAGHIRSYAERRDEYVQRIADFFDKAILP